MIRFVLYFILIFEFFIRLSSNKKSDQLQVLLMSVLIQSLMIYPILFDIFAVEKFGLEYFGAPFELSTGIYFPSVIAIVMIVICKKKQKWCLKDIRFAFLSILIAFVFSYISPYNLSFNATNIALCVFIQVGVAVYAAKTCLDNKQIVLALYDGLRIIIYVELFVCFTYLLGFDQLQSLFLPNIKEMEWIREGTSVRRCYGTVWQPNRLGGLCAFICVFFISCYINGYKKRKSIVTAGIALFVVILSQSRSAFLASSIASIILYLACAYKKHKFSMGYLVLLGVVVILSLIGLFNFSIIGDMFFKSNADDMTDARLIHYYAGFDILRQTDNIGVGLNSHVFFMYKHVGSGVLGSWIATRPIHSVHLVIWVELGLIGFLCWLYFVVSRVVRFFQTPLHQMNNPIIWLAFIGMLIIIVIHGFSDCLYFHYQYLMLLMLVGAFYSRIPKYNL